jgi:hypothetical protein
MVEDQHMPTLNYEQEPFFNEPWRYLPYTFTAIEYYSGLDLPWAPGYQHAGFARAPRTDDEWEWYWAAVETLGENVTDPAEHDYWPAVSRGHHQLGGHRAGEYVAYKDGEDPNVGDRQNGTAIFEFRTDVPWSVENSERVVVVEAYLHCEILRYQETGGTCCETCGATEDLHLIPGHNDAYLCSPCNQKDQMHACIDRYGE